MTIRQYCRNTQTNPGTGGGNIVFDLSETAGGASTIISDNLNSETFTERLRWQIDVDDTIDGTSFPTSMQISSLDGTLEYRWRVQRLSSTNAVQASSDYSATFSAAGTNTATLSLSTTWATGDRLALSLEIRRSGGHGNVAITTSTTTNSWVDADFAVPIGDIPAVVGHETAGNTTGASANASLPANSAAYLAIICALDADSVTPPANWTPIEDRTYTNNNYRLYYAQDADSPGTSWAWDPGVSNDKGIRVVVVGFDQEIAIHQEGYADNTLTCPDITTAVEALICRIVTFGSDGSPPRVIFPGADNQIEEYTFAASTDQPTVAFSTDDLDPPGDTLTAEYTMDSGNSFYPVAGTVAIVRADALPTADAGTDQEVLVDTTGVQLDGSGSGGAGAPFTYEWTQISGTSVTLSSTTVANPTFTAPSSPGTLVFGLTVEDTNSVPSAQDTVTITVTEPPQPVSAYGFNEGSGTTSEDDTGNDFTLAALNNPGSWSLNSKNGVYAANDGHSFTGMIAPSASLPEFTIMAWVYITGGSDPRMILGYSPDGTGGLYFGLLETGELNVRVGPTDTWVSDEEVTTSQWVHTAIVYKQGVPVIFYLDAVATGLSSGGSASSTFDLGTDEYVVGGQQTGIDASYPFEGQIDDLRVFDAALTQQEIEDWMNTPIEGGTATPTGLVATAISSSQIDLTWDAVAGATGYDVERDSIVIAYDVPTNSYSDTTGLDPDTQYTYRVRAVLE